VDVRRTAAVRVTVSLLVCVLVGLSPGRVHSALGPWAPVPDRDGDGKFGQEDDASVWEDRGRSLQAMLDRTGALGAYLRDDGTVVVVLPASGATSFREADAEAMGFDVIVETAPLDPGEPAAIKSAADAYRSPDGLRISGFFSARLGRVVLISSDENAVAHIEQLFPGKTLWMPAADVSGFASRSADYEPHWGGAQMRGPWPGPHGWNCSSGYSVTNAAGNPRMVTAGHCFDGPDAGAAGDLGADVVSPGGDSFGEVKNVAFSDSLDMDAMLVGGSGVSMGGRIYRGTFGTNGDNGHPVYGAADVTSLSRYCAGGARREELCDQRVEDTSFTFCGGPNWTPPCISQTVLTYGPGICKGDSGGPMYYLIGAGVSIRGHVSGWVPASRTRILGYEFSPDNEGCAEANSHGGFTYGLNVFIKWSRVESYFDVTIKTSS
jgi:hypothetical protein